MRRHLGPSWRSLAALFALAGCNVSHSASSCDDASSDDAAIDAAAPDADVDAGPSLALSCPGSERIVGSRAGSYAPNVSLFATPTALTENAPSIALPSERDEYYGAVVDPESGDVFVQSPLHSARVDAHGNVIWTVDVGAPSFPNGTDSLHMLDLGTHELWTPIENGLRAFDMQTGAHRDVLASAPVPLLWFTPDGRAIGVTASAPVQFVSVGRDGTTEIGAPMPRLDGAEIVGADCERAYVVGYQRNGATSLLSWLIAVRLDDRSVEWRVSLENILGVQDALVLRDRIVLVVARTEGVLERGVVSSGGAPGVFARLATPAAPGSFTDLVPMPDGGDSVVAREGLAAFSPDGTVRTSSTAYGFGLGAQRVDEMRDGRIASLSASNVGPPGAWLAVTSLVTLLAEPTVTLDVTVGPDCAVEASTFLPSPTGAYLVDCENRLHVLGATP